MKERGMRILMAAGMMAFAAGLLAAESLDVYMAVPIVIDRTDGNDLNVTAIGGGLKFSTIDEDDWFGLGAGLVAYCPLAVSWTQGTGLSTKSVGDVYSAPVGLDLLLGLDINRFWWGFLSFPLSLGFHSKVDFYEPGTQINFGIAGSVGVQLNMGDLGFFVRGQVSYDFGSTQYLKASGDWHGSLINQWGIQPQIGVRLSD